MRRRRTALRAWWLHHVHAEVQLQLRALSQFRYQLRYLPSASIHSACEAIITTCYLSWHLRSRFAEKVNDASKVRPSHVDLLALFFFYAIGGCAFSGC